MQPTCEQLVSLVVGAEVALNRKLSNGERVDLVLDNFLDVLGSYDARLLLAQCGMLS